MKIIGGFQSKTDYRRGEVRLLYIIFTFKENDKKLKIIYLIEPYTYFNISRLNSIKKETSLKKSLLSKEMEIEYDKLSKIITKFNFDIAKYIRKKS